MARWVQANSGIGKSFVNDYTPYKFKVSLDNTYVYSIDQWELSSAKDGMETHRSYDETNNPYGDYWKSGLTLREYIEKAKDDPVTYNPTNWEMLLSEDDVKSSPQKVSYARVADACYSEYNSDKEEIRELARN